MSDRFLGTGWAFPPSFDPTTGQAQMVAAEEDIRQAIELLLRTAPGERPLRPAFGAGIDRYAFATLDRTTLALLRDSVEDALLRFEPRVILDDVIAEPRPTQGRVDLTIRYRVPGTNPRRNLVFPFYLGEATGAP